MNANSVELERKERTKILLNETAANKNASEVVFAKTEEKRVTDVSQFTLSALSRIERRQYVANFIESKVEVRKNESVNV